MTDPQEKDLSLSEDPALNYRVFTQQDVWYFETREGQIIGPFRYRSEAENNLDHFMANLREKLAQPE